jgi:hypothetical protein
MFQESEPIGSIQTCPLTVPALLKKVSDALVGNYPLHSGHLTPTNHGQNAGSSRQSLKDEIQ